jgi:hypothetical protein
LLTAWQTPQALSACDEAIDPEGLSLLRAPPHHFDDAKAIARFDEILVVVKRLVRTVTARSLSPEPFAAATAARIVCG